MSQLPIDNVLPQLLTTLATHRNAVLIAAPGAGKTTQVPPALLDETWLSGRKILMLEPRRLAARNAATWMAQQLGEKAGQTIGYRMRMDSKVGPGTRIEVVTEGILTRLLQQDPALEEYGIVIFDEYHERSLQADLGLALCLESQQSLREDLRILIMSATLEYSGVAKLLGDAPLIQSEGRSFPVSQYYLPGDANQHLEQRVSSAVLQSLDNEPGSILVFLPGAGEIHRVHDRLQEQISDNSISLHPLYSHLSQGEQEQAIAPAPPGKRKIVLATTIAESSLTIEGVRVVVDAGLTRVPHFDPGSGMTRLQTLRVTRASAEQRCGRAGRTEPGTCYRLWDEATQHGLLAFNTPEILQADLAPLALELAQWGVREPQQLSWLDPPPATAYGRAMELLQELGAIDAQQLITAHGKAMLGLGLHPRLAHMLLKAKDLGQGALACDIAALLNERDPFRLSASERVIDLGLRLEALHDHSLHTRYRVDKETLQRIKQSAKDLRQRLHIEEKVYEANHAGRVLALAYPDRIAQARGKDGRYLMRNGKGAIVNTLDPLCHEPWLVLAELDGQAREARVFLAAPISLAEIETDFADQIDEEARVEWDDKQQKVIAAQQQCLGALVLADKPIAQPDAGLIRAGLLQGISQRGIDCLPWDSESRNWQQRVLLLRREFKDDNWPDVSDSALLESLADWLGPYLNGLNKLSQVQELNLPNILNGMLDWPQQQRLNELAPTHLQVPSGSRIAIDYQAEVPVLAVRLQELFGLNETPTIARGKLALLLHLLSPARRPIQVTRDLQSFWQNTYVDVKKDLKGRYPKHYWPDDPLIAEPTSRAKPRGQ